MMMILQSVETVEVAKGILSVESVSAIGVLLFFIAFLIYDRVSLVKKAEEAQNKVLSIMEDRLTDAKEHSNDISKIREDFKQMVQDIRNVYGSSKTG